MTKGTKIPFRPVSRLAQSLYTELYENGHIDLIINHDGAQPVVRPTPSKFSLEAGRLADFASEKDKIKMTEPKDLLKRLNDIGRSLANTPHALALLGLGSSGQELDRMDAYSDLDFFVLVEEGYQEHFLKDLSWLSTIAPIGFHFMNTEDGYKLLFQDGIFCEFAIFEPQQLRDIPYSPGRIVWKAAGVSDKIAQPKPAKPGEKRPVDWLIGEALTNLYVGLGRERRGERLSALQFIQGYAVDRLIDLSAHIVSATGEPTAPAYPDTFDSKRRYEARYPALAQQMPRFLQGYDHNC